MVKLTILNLILILINIGILKILKDKCKTDKAKYIVLLIIPILTIVCHYSSIFYHFITDKSHLEHVKDNPNLLVPIYPCNVVMWCSLLLGIMKDKKSNLSKFLIDYLFWFGTISSFVGMVVNIDFFNNPTLLNYDVTKGIIAHATLLLNSLALIALGFVKVKLEKNLFHILISIIMMFVVGLYCNTLFTVIVSSSYAYNVNSMFILHSPFEGLNFLTYPFIAFASFLLYFIIFIVLENIKYDKDSRWYNRIKRNKE